MFILRFVMLMLLRKFKENCKMHLIYYGYKFNNLFLLSFIDICKCILNVRIYFDYFYLIQVGGIVFPRGAI